MAAGSRSELEPVNVATVALPKSVKDGGLNPSVSLLSRPTADVLSSK